MDKDTKMEIEMIRPKCSIETEAKICVRCKLEKSTEEFRLQKFKTKDGFGRSRCVKCKKCDSERGRNWILANKFNSNKYTIMIKEPKGKRKCETCGEWKPIEQFRLYRHSEREGNPSYRANICNKCNNLSKKIYLDTHPPARAAVRDSNRITQENWCARHHTIIYKKSEKLCIPCTVTVQDILNVLPQNMRCPILRTKFIFGKRSRDNASIDRIIPELGYVPGNIQIISHRGNSLKSDATPKELYKVYMYAKQETERVLYGTNYIVDESYDYLLPQLSI